MNPWGWAASGEESRPQPAPSRLGLQSKLKTMSLPRIETRVGTSPLTL